MSSLISIPHTRPLRPTKVAISLASSPGPEPIDLGGVALAGSPAEFGKLIADETEKWAKVIKFAGIKPQ